MNPKNQKTPFGRRNCVCLCVVLASLSACKTSTDGDFCALYEPIFPDYARDTPETLRQIERNNVVYEMCL